MKKQLFAVISIIIASLFCTACDLDIGEIFGGKKGDYAITYQLDGGKNNKSNKSYYYKDKGFTLYAPTKTGYSFVGWTGSDILTPTITVIVEGGTTGNKIFTANWNINNYTLTFNSNGGSLVSNIEQEYLTEVAEPVKPTRANYSFDGWYLDESLKTKCIFPYAMPCDGKRLYAKWTPNEFDLIFDANGGALTTTVDSYNIESDFTLPKPTKRFFAFDGWYNGTTLVPKIEAGMSGNLTLVAHWVPATNNITYDHNTDTFLLFYLEKKLVTPSSVEGEKIIPDNYTLRAGEVVIKQEFAQSLTNGDYVFLCVCPGEDELFYVEVINNPAVEKEYKTTSALLGERKYFQDTFTWSGKTHNCYLEDEYELLTAMKYAYLVDSVVEKGYKGGYYEKGFCLAQDYYELISPNMETYIQDILNRISTPMLPSSSYSLRNSSPYIFTIKISFTSELNTLTTSTIAAPLDDVGNLQADGQRSADFDDFKIEDNTKTQEMRTLYELENLEYGVKPTFSGVSYASRVYNKAKDVLRDIIDDTMTDIEKAKQIFYWLAINVNYDDAAIPVPSQGAYRSYTSYGALIDGKAVCDGIASAYKLLCLIEGIEAVEISGKGGDGGHAWNKIRVENTWYCVDATWSHYSNSDAICLDYMLRSDSFFIDTEHVENGCLDIPFIEKIAVGFTED